MTYKTAFDLYCVAAAIVCILAGLSTRRYTSAGDRLVLAVLSAFFGFLLWPAFVAQAIFGVARDDG